MGEITLKILNNSGEKLSGILHSCTERKLLAIFCHGFLLSKDKPPAREFCEELNRAGLNAFRFDFSGYSEDYHLGDSEGKFEYSSKQADDLNSVIKYFSRKNYQIQCVIGHSMGGSVAILQAALNSGIVHSVIAVAPRIIPANHSIAREIKENGKSIDEFIRLEKDPPYYYKGRYTISKRYLEEIRDLRIIDVIGQIKIPLLLLHGTRDNDVNITEIKMALEAAHEPKEYIPIPEADHTFSNQKYQYQMILSAVAWLKRALAYNDLSSNR